MLGKDSMTIFFCRINEAWGLCLSIPNDPSVPPGNRQTLFYTNGNPDPKPYALGQSPIRMRKPAR